MSLRPQQQSCPSLLLISTPTSSSSHFSSLPKSDQVRYRLLQGRNFFHLITREGKKESTIQTSSSMLSALATSLPHDEHRASTPAHTTPPFLLPMTEPSRSRLKANTHLSYRIRAAPTHVILLLHSINSSLTRFHPSPQKQLSLLT